MGQNHSHHGADNAHSHDAHGASCPVHNSRQSQRRLAIAAVITGSFMLAEVAGGLISGSLALLADAGHMLTDFAALVLAWFGFSASQRPASKRHNFGLERFQILTAFVNGLTLIAVSAWIFIEAVKRLITPGEVLAGPMLIVAIIGLFVNLFVFWLLLGADRENLNIRGAVLHVLGDLLGSVAAIIAAIVIMQTGWVQIDPILSFLVVLLILRSAWRLVKESAHILLEGAPAGFDAEALSRSLKENFADILDITDMRAWSITPAHKVLTLKVLVAAETDIADASRRLKAHIHRAASIDDVTIEFTPDTS